MRDGIRRLGARLGLWADIDLEAERQAAERREAEEETARRFGEMWRRRAGWDRFDLRRGGRYEKIMRRRPPRSLVQRTRDASDYHFLDRKGR